MSLTEEEKERYESQYGNDPNDYVKLYDLTCSMKKIVNHKIPCYASSSSWIFKFIKKFGKGAKVSREMYK